jgi:DNA-binding CsgD family transcriptional regulator
MKIQSRFTKVAVAAGLVVMSGAAVLGITSIASAQVGQQASVVAVADAVDVVPAATETTVPGAPAAPKMHANRPSPLVTVAKALNMTEAELKAELVAGKSVADVAKAQNVDIDTVIAALTTEFKAHLAEEVTSGKHTQAEADAKLAEFSTRVTTMVNTAGLPQGKGGPGGHEGKGGPRGGKFASEAVATTLKLTAAELKTELQAGKSLATIAKAQNVDIADVKATLTTEFKAHLAEEVTSGKHTQAEADAKLAEFSTRLDDMVNNVRPAGGPEGRGKGGRGHGPMGGHGRMGGHGPMGDAPTVTPTALGTSASA